MGIILGTPKYIIGVLLSGTGFACMYLFGGTIFTFFNTLDQLLSGNYLGAFIEYYIKSALPPTSLEHIFTQAIVGACIAGLFWFLGMAKRTGITF